MDQVPEPRVTDCNFFLKKRSQLSSRAILETAESFRLQREGEKMEKTTSGNGLVKTSQLTSVQGLIYVDEDVSEV